MRKFYQGETACFVVVPPGELAEGAKVEARVVDCSGEVVATYSSDAKEEAVQVKRLTEGKWGFMIDAETTATMEGRYGLEVWTEENGRTSLMARSRFWIRRSTRGEEQA